MSQKGGFQLMETLLTAIVFTQQLSMSDGKFINRYESLLMHRKNETACRVEALLGS